MRGHTRDRSTFMGKWRNRAFEREKRRGLKDVPDDGKNYK